MKYNNVIRYNKSIDYTLIAPQYNFPFYCVVAKFNSGGRYYSEKLRFDKATKRFEDYASVVSYFGGGILELYDSEGNIIKSEKIH